MEVQIIDLERNFGRLKAVNGISFAFSSGHVFGFIGPNGAGKTTTMKVLATLDQPTGGDVLLDGVSVLEYPIRTRALLGFMPDSLPAHNDITVHEYIDFFARAHGLRGKERLVAINRIEDFTGLLSLKSKLLKSLSKGMKQRVSLARTIIHDPAVLVLDEPAAGLDPRARIELRELLRVLCDQGKAILISSHILTELSDICNGAIIIETGNILRAGTMQELMQEVDAVRRISISLVEGDYEKLRSRLLLQVGVEDATITGDRVLVDIKGDEALHADLLTSIVGEGFRVSRFHAQQANLETVFMDITRGEVQ